MTVVTHRAISVLLKAAKIVSILLPLSLTPWPTKAQDVQITRFIALGDMPYGEPDLVYPLYESLIGEINTRSPELVIHVGDTKGGGACTDAILRAQLDFMNMFNAPVLYTPGDNEWTDCYRADDDPLERLDFIRKTFFANPDTSLGKVSISLQHQGALGYPENARFRSGQIGFVTAHVVGSNNNFETRELSAAEEFFARSKASSDWLVESVSEFRDAEVIVLAIHADMFEFDFNEFKSERWLRHSGFGAFGEALKSSARKFGKPMLLVFGDSHRHRIFQPFPMHAPNLTAVEVFGYRDMHAVEVTVRLGQDTPFQVVPVWNPALVE